MVTLFFFMYLGTFVSPSIGDKLFFKESSTNDSDIDIFVKKENFAASFPLVESACIRFGGHPPSVYSQEDIDFLAENVLDNNYWTDRSQGAWLNIRRINREYVW